ncbi:hypothetical protein SUGI_0728900 [Cryptomeria japonica]|nr:hypothetical protein SUGI_0728900 [Cryptomeria japonica]
MFCTWALHSIISLISGATGSTSTFLETWSLCKLMILLCASSLSRIVLEDMPDCSFLKCLQILSYDFIDGDFIDAHFGITHARIKGKF